MEMSTFNFNKQILLGEIGAEIGAPLAAHIVSSQFTKTASIISVSAVIGSILGAAIFWLITRIYDQRKQKEFSFSKLSKDIAFFTPAAFLFTLIAYYPTLYFLSNTLLARGDNVIISVIASQIIAFTLFMVIINIYRNILIKHIGREL